MAADAKPWQSQLPGRGNNIPESHLRRFGLGKRANAAPGEPTDAALARFLKDEL